MKLLLFTLFCFSTAYSAFSQNTKKISYRENFFGTQFYLVDGKKVKAQEVSEILAIFPEEELEFYKAQNQLQLGQGLRWGGIALGFGSFGYLLAGEMDQTRALIGGGMFIGSLLGIAAGIPIVRNSKRRASNAIEIYNYKKSQGVGYDPSLQFKMSPLGMSLRLNF